MTHSSHPYPPAAFESLFHRESTNWWFIQRNQLILWALQRFMPTFDSLLEIGCGTGFVLQAIHAQHPHATLTGTDYFAEGLAYAKQRLPNVHLMQLDAQTMSDTQKYDVIGAFDVLEHIPDDQLVLQNCARALTPNGMMFISVPQHMWLWSHADVYAAHARRYTEKDLHQKLQCAGLHVVYSTSFVSLLVPLMLLVRIRVTADSYNPDAEFDISPTLNTILKTIMQFELWMLRMGIRFPIGGSRFMVAQKRT
ncbi:MAG: class I SAM-dependent methyltransferase [Chloroflexota bacterium]|jgi:SAM-dependent methyltransferase